MRLLFGKICFVGLLFVVLSCKGTNKSFETIVPDSNKIDSVLLDSAVHVLIESLPDSAGIDIRLLKKLHETVPYSVLWVNARSGIERTDTLLLSLSDAQRHGLSPEIFSTDTLAFLKEKFRNSELSYSEIAQFEVNATLSFLKYCRAMQFGIVEPDVVLPGNYIPRKSADSVFVVKCLLNVRSNLSAFLKSVQPVDSNYLALQQMRNFYLQYQDSLIDSIPLLPDKKTVKLHTHDSIIPLVIRRLLITGELTRETAGDINRTLFDEKLLKALDKFRYKTGLYLDKEIGNNTIRALNMSFADYVNRVDVNLERLRWKTAKSLGRKHIRVNVADMTLRAFRNDTLALKMNVVVGKAPLNKTPLLQSSVYEIVLNPTWTVPNSIVVKEISVLQTKDTSYLRRHKMRVYYKGVEQKPDTIKWNRISKKYQPYVIVQDSGNINALGRIKFNFGNRFSVYLHDTNARSAFSRHNRALSHGCVRVSKPYELAFFCLPEYDLKDKKRVEQREVFEDKIRYSTGLKVKTISGKKALEEDSAIMRISKIQLRQLIPIIIEYHTCFRNEKNEVIFRDDIYGIDKSILAYLRKYKAN